VFLTPLKATHIARSTNWVLDAPLTYIDKDDQRWTAPAGMSTDLYSTPGVFRGFLFRARAYPEAAVIHDAGYRGLLLINDELADVTRSEADDLLRECLQDLKAPRTLIYTLYSGVRVGGFRAFRNV